MAEDAYSYLHQKQSPDKSIISVRYASFKNQNLKGVFIMQLPVTIEIRGLRVLTTEQLAKSYGTTAKILQYNFSYNKKRYIEGKHYISLQGDELKRFKANLEIQGNLKYAHTLYLWTEKGALLHAKSLNTDKAWEVYDYLVDFYFRAKETEPVQEIPKRGRRVVDAPQNMKIQNAITEIRKCLAAYDVVLQELDNYKSLESYEQTENMLDTLWICLGNKTVELGKIKPNIITEV